MARELFLAAFILLAPPPLEETPLDSQFYYLASDLLFCLQNACEEKSGTIDLSELIVEVPEEVCDPVSICLEQ